MIVVYFILAALGTLLPLICFAVYFIAGDQITLTKMLGDLFPNPLAAGFTIDVLMSILVFMVWLWTDRRRSDVQWWWVSIPLCFSVGLSAGLPVYLMLRERSCKNGE